MINATSTNLSSMMAAITSHLAKACHDVGVHHSYGRIGRMPVRYAANDRPLKFARARCHVDDNIEFRRAHERRLLSRYPDR